MQRDAARIERRQSLPASMAVKPVPPRRAICASPSKGVSALLRRARLILTGRGLRGQTAAARVHQSGISTHGCRRCGLSLKSGGRRGSLATCPHVRDPHYQHRSAARRRARQATPPSRPHQCHVGSRAAPYGRSAATTASARARACATTFCCSARACTSASRVYALVQSQLVAPVKSRSIAGRWVKREPRACAPQLLSGRWPRGVPSTWPPSAGVQHVKAVTVECARASAATSRWPFTASASTRRQRSLSRRGSVGRAARRTLTLNNGPAHAAAAHLQQPLAAVRTLSCACIAHTQACT
jgi:hypothetical protein